MNTGISPTNPFRASRYAWAWEQVRELRPAAHLDIGCFDGAWLASLDPLGVERRAGYDLNSDSIAVGQRSYPQLELERISDIRALPAPDASFDSVSLLDVYEHLDGPSQRGVMDEIQRVLKPSGAVLVTVPRRHVFSVLDTGNFKFRVPGLHRRFVTFRHGEAYYRSRYVSNEHGLVGDIMASKRWHQHFADDELAGTLRSHGFDVTGIDGSGFFMRPLLMVKLVAPGPLRARVKNVLTADEQRFHSANLFVRAVKSPAVGAGG